MTEKLTRNAYAKINLFLQVRGKRSDGYHELVTLMSCIGLYDVLMLDGFCGFGIGMMQSVFQDLGMMFLLMIV